jgi:3-hydroxyisobutyrate dehydrogenase-like beta-hydroxyacid dehydrogenase
MSETIAFLGLGHMGRGMAGRLAQTGFPLRVWNRTPGKEDAAWKSSVARSPAEAVSGADFVVSMLANDEAVEAAILGQDGALPAMRTGAIHLSASTVSVELTRTLAARHAARKVGFLATPVFGRPEAAAAGQLFVLCGGDPVVRERSATLLAAMGQAVLPLETPEQALLAKLSGNLMIAVVIESLGEVLALGEKGGLPPEQLLAILTGTLFGAPVVKRYGEMIVKQQFTPAGFALPLGLKDVSLALAASSGLEVPLPLASLIRDRMIAAIAQGRGDQDWSAMAALAREGAGLARAGTQASPFAPSN